MPAFIIGYDLNRPHQDYPDLINAIKNLSGTWWHHLDSTWIVVSTQSAVQIRNLLAQHIDDNDELFVGRLAGEAAWRGFNERGGQWLLDNLNQ